MADPIVPAKIVHTMFTFIAPRGVQFVDWHTHHEIRFLKSDGKLLLEWWKVTLARMEQELPDLCEERVVTQCDDCNGHGRTGDNKVCMSCFGSGRKGFRPPGVVATDEPAPVTVRNDGVQKDESVIDQEVLHEARRIIEERRKQVIDGAVPRPFVPVQPLVAAISPDLLPTK
jgi:hypothetical protein